MNNLKLAEILTDAVEEVMDQKSGISMDSELKGMILEAIYEHLNKEIY